MGCGSTIPEDDTGHPQMLEPLGRQEVEVQGAAPCRTAPAGEDYSGAWNAIWYHMTQTGVKTEDSWQF